MVCTDGSVHGFGQNDSGQLGFTPNTTNSTPINISSYGSLNGKFVVAAASNYGATYILCADATLHSFGDGRFTAQVGSTTNDSTARPPTDITSAIVE